MKKLLYTALISLCLAFVSCDNLLDCPPLDKIGNQSYWKTPTDFANYTLQFYSKFPSFNTGTTGYLGMLGEDEFQGTDHGINLSTANPTLNSAVSISATNSKWNWTDIRAVNIFFENLAKTVVPFKDIKHYVGEAYFFKAWFYFEKIKNFGDVPWFSNTLYMDSPELYKVRDLRNQVIDSTLAMIDKAIENLSMLKDLNTLGGSNRLSKEAALAFKTRVALFEGTWEKYHDGSVYGVQNPDPNKYFHQVVAAAEELMNNTATYKVSIYDKNLPNEDYGYIFSREDMSAITEIIFWKRYGVDLALSNNFQPFVSGFTNGVSITDNLVRNYLKTDGTVFGYDGLIASGVKGNAFLTALATNLDPRFKQTIHTPGATICDNTVNGLKTFSKPSLSGTGNSYNATGYALRKGLDPKNVQAGGGTTTPGATGSIIFRYAEVLLNYAEAKAELSETVDYSKSLDLLRNRAGIPNFNATLTDNSRNTYADFGYTISNELYEIRRERAVELASEGFRKWDYLRWAAHKLFKDKRPKGYPFDASEWGTTNIVTKRDPSGLMDPLQTSIPLGYQFNTERDYLDFIPTNEITINPLLKQNPGWN